MKNKIKLLFGALAATAMMAAGANAEHRSYDDVGSRGVTYGSCGSGFSFHSSRGSYRGGAHVGGGYSGSYGYRDRCRVIDRSYFSRGCVRYCRITYLHERYDRCGRVVRHWRTCRTVRCY